MTPHEFLKQQAKNVEQALTETLRYDYGPKLTSDYYQECCKRLDLIKIAISTTSPTDLTGIEARLDELIDLSVWISLIERSRLGEFSWPFAEALRDMAKQLLAERALSGGTLQPIVHVIADGEGYFIHYEKTSASGKQKFAFINFPRPLKHHVLLHSLFGHELGHTALHSVGAGTILQNDVMNALQSSGPLSSNAAMTSWVHDAAAPNSVKRELANFQTQTGAQYAFEDYYRLSWIDELICDLFGLLLFGPGFAAAHQAYLRPMQSNPYELGLFGATHPPYAVRQRMLVRAMQLVGWAAPFSQNNHIEMPSLTCSITYLLTCTNLATVLSDQQLNQAIAGIQRVFLAYGGFAYAAPDPTTLNDLVKQLEKRLPPIITALSHRGVPELREINIAHTLYAGWVYFLGAHRLTSEPLPFLETNMLCDHALLQQRAINIAIAKRLK
jgi:hypothetical protein